MAKSPFAGVKSSAMRTPIERSSTINTLPIEKIIDRPGGDTRPLNQQHIEALAESIAALGLIQPIAVDNQGCLLAGSHRRAAINYLQESDPDVYQQHFAQGIPIHRYNFDAVKEPEMALAIEATENEHRRDYTPLEIRELADRLKKAGFNYTQGRAKKGQKSLLPSIMLITGKSKRTVQRYLEGDAEKKVSNDHFKSQVLSTARSLRKLQSFDELPDDLRKLAEQLAQKLEKSRDRA